MWLKKMAKLGALLCVLGLANGAAASTIPAGQTFVFEMKNPWDKVYFSKLVDLGGLKGGDPVISFEVEVGPSGAFLRTLQLLGEKHRGYFDLTVNQPPYDWTQVWSAGPEQAYPYHDYLNVWLPPGTRTFDVFLRSSASPAPAGAYTRVAFGDVPSLVPLPASVLMLLGAVAGLSALRWGRAVSGSAAGRLRS